MENIEIRGPQQGKRSMESLIEDSAIDLPFDYEGQRLRKAFNQTIIAMNSKQAEKERQLQKLKIQLREKQQHESQYQNNVRKLQEDLKYQQNQYSQLSNLYKDTKKRLQCLEYKLSTLQASREVVEEAEWQTEKEVMGKKKMQNEICKEFRAIISKKVEYFVCDIKKMSLSQQVQEKIESFLEELLLINPYSQMQHIKQIRKEQRNQIEGTIRKDNTHGLQDADDWQLLEKSLEKLRGLNSSQNQGHLTNPKVFTSLKEEMRDRSVSVNKRRRLFL